MDHLKKIKISLLFLTVATALIGVFLPARILPDVNIRSFYHLWEGCHLLLFFLGCHVFYIFSPQFKNPISAKNIAIFFFFAAVCSLTIEGTQTLISGKEIEYSDIVFDLAGVLLFCSFHSRHKRPNTYLLHGSALLITGFVLWPILYSFTDEILAKHQFPLLADFETPFEASRFKGKIVEAIISADRAYHGQQSLRLNLPAGPWSGTMLTYFPSNWQEYTQLHFAIYNSNIQPVALHVLIHDDLHKPDNKLYNDLYSQISLLPPGIWTKVSIPLERVQYATGSRQIDLGHIHGLGFFVVETGSPLTLYLDTVKLE